jgi:hypothetical protein
VSPPTDDDAWIWAVPRAGDPSPPPAARNNVIVIFHGGTLDGRGVMLPLHVTEVRCGDEVYDIARDGYYRTGVIR